MPFYIMRQDKSIDGSRSLHGLPKDWDPEALLRGEAPPGGPAAVTLKLSRESGSYRGHIIDGLLTLYHKALRKALDDNGVTNIRYHPVSLLDPNTGKLDESYFIASITSVLDCVDMEKSKVKYWASGSGGFDFESMVIDAAKTEGLKMFRLKDDPTKVIINEELKRFFDEAKMLAGVKLIQTEDYSDF